MGKLTIGGPLKLWSWAGNGVSFSRPRPDVDDFARVEALRNELHRLRGEVRRLEEDKRDLEGRVASLARELEHARGENPETLATS